MPGNWTVRRDLLDGPSHVWPAHLLGRNEYGTWLYAPTGTTIHTSAGETVDVLDNARMHLVPVDRWWVATWGDDGSIVVNVTTPAELSGPSVRYVDLAVNVRAGDGHGVADGDAHHGARAAGLVTDDLDGAARAALADVSRQLADRAEPFGQVGWRWFHGITRSELHVVPYDPSWPMKFAVARDELLPILPQGSRVEHFGSTSVPGLAAKDCLDIAVVVPRLDQFGDVIARLESSGYKSRPKAFGEDPGHVFLRRLTAGRRTHHVHLYHDGHPNLTGVLAFRDLLRVDPAARHRYEQVKLALADAAPYDRSGYEAGKREVVQDLLRLALARLERQRKDSPG